MNITTTKMTRTTFVATKRLSTPVPTIEAGRGLYWRYDCDEVAMGEAQSFHDAATRALRERAKNAEAPVSMRIDRDEDGLFAVCETTITNRT